MPSDDPRPRRGWWSVTLSDVGDALLGLVTTAVGLGVAIAVVDGVRATNPGAVVLAALLVGAGDLVLRPPLRVLARVGGAMGALVAGLGAQVAVVWLALSLGPGLEVRSAWAVVQVLVITACVMAVGRWVWGASDSDYVVGDVLRRARARARRAGEGGGAVPDHRPPGLLVVQLDGVGTAVLEQALDAGLAPTMARWLESGSHRLTSWWAQAPSTTPASQAGLLHGAADAIPSFRWWDRDAGRLVVTNHPDDAAMVERRLSDGRGLLADGGAAVSTMFSGDATRQLLVMSQARRGIGPGTSYLRFFASPFVLARAVTLTVGEMVKELYQGRRQRVRDVRPRVPRRGWYVVLRGVTNVLLRDLATSLVAEQLVRGAPVVFVDLVDYDEIAHHAGPTRPESLRALDGLDGVLDTLQRVADAAPRDYRVVVLSDHGQALGPTFAQVAGEPLVEVVRRRVAAGREEPPQDRATGAEGGGRAGTALGRPGGATDVDAVQAASDEEWGPLNAFLSSAASRHGEDRAVVLGPPGKDRRDGERATAGDGAPPPEVAVTGSGNLGMVWFPREPRRLVLEEVETRWPGLVRGLASTPGIGLVLVDTAARGLAAVGTGGIAWLEPDEADGLPAVDGTDPVARYGPRAAADLRRLGRLGHVGDLVVLSDVTPGGRVHAFEGQVGSHGGLGGPQNRAVLLHPAELPVDDDLLEDVDGERIAVGADRVHLQLLRWATALGLRRDATPPAAAGEDGAAPAARPAGRRRPGDGS
ncbi:phage holin family protein [Cellulomonas sp. ES6]|uniref:phage holin family protein n=1 Tax=Cellulomonas sp. ES6 TaxID=3039384 RepID=UPI0024B68FB1|nr:phage holin family protein [Cellulomonas sp. ES6]WHP17510.1 phage holin family protein [Cellulomonas sp. ES6]